MLYSEKLSFTIEGHIKSFPDKKKLEEFITTKPLLHEMSKGKDKERILKAAREKKLVTYRGVPIRLSDDFSKETFQARRDWQEIFKVMESGDL